MFKKHKKKSTTFLLLAILLCVIDTTYATNNVSMKWVIYAGCTNVIDSIINTWTNAGNQKLCNDRDGAGSSDVSVDTVLVFEGNDAQENWTCWFGDDDVTSDFIAFMIHATLDAHSEDICGVSKIEIDSKTYTGMTSSLGGSSIIISGEADNSTLVHEIGHCAWLDDISDASTRIMYKNSNPNTTDVITCCPINGDEKAAYEALQSL